MCKNEAPPPACATHSSVTTKSILNEKHLNYRMSGIKVRET